MARAIDFAQPVVEQIDWAAVSDMPSKDFVTNQMLSEEGFDPDDGWCVEFNLREEAIAKLDNEVLPAIRLHFPGIKKNLYRAYVCRLCLRAFWLSYKGGSIPSIQ